MDEDSPANIKHEKDEDEGLDGEEEPQEELEFNRGDDGGTVWLAKIPKSLLEAWLQVQEPGVHLGTLRVYEQPRKGETGPNISLLLPQNPRYDPGDEYSGAVFDVRMTDEKVHSQYVVADADKPGEKNKRLRKTRLAGRVHHKVHLMPRQSAAYDEKVKKRAAEKNRPKKQIQKLYDSKQDVEMGATNLKMIQSGAAQSSTGFGTLGKGKKTGKVEFERAARVGQDELMDELFALFAEKPYWTMRELRTKTIQPEAYLKETLLKIGMLHKSGPHNNHWCLTSSYADGAPDFGPGPGEASGSGSNAGAGPSGSGGTQETMEDDEDEDEEMEEIL
ncbi:hypothetical protein BOTBODRAFT_179648 [Botryobasidium botryosum FD-172 SS1]|uniref:Transcription initiation factor IIF subunit beta n=1 Tax=Botryobasidium botryosum (strain FD-172 SS1) TaxID=930990 RepID=A0A067MA48_BOTB1|nr:hypothetical protein BOTBODRAFT_179648 [Botryobasidium botryosum FD-172 SS1]